MQTFLPYSSFLDSARCLDTKRLGKQRVEGLQILQALLRGPKSCTNCLLSESKCACKHRNIRSTPWYNHPATQLWKGHERSFQHYVLTICEEWISRGFKDTVKPKVWDIFLNMSDPICPEWNAFYHPPIIGDKEFHNSHKSALLLKYPEHYSQFNWNVKPQLNYKWKL